VLRAEAGVILKTWAGRVKVSTEAKAERRMRSGIAWKMGIQSAGGSNPYGITVNDASRGGGLGMVWFRTKKNKWQTPGTIYSGGHFSQNHLHFKADDWARIEAGAVTYGKMLAERRPKVMASLGLSRQSVIQIAEDLGIDLMSVKGGKLSAAGYAKGKAAMASNGAQYKNGSGFQGGNDVKCYIDLLNHLPYNRKIGMDSQLLSIVSSRAKYIEQSYQKGAFDSMKKTAAAFPNLFKVSGMDVSAPPAEAE
jgi:hypothetical protein